MKSREIKETAGSGLPTAIATYTWNVTKILYWREDREESNCKKARPL